MTRIVRLNQEISNFEIITRSENLYSLQYFQCWLNIFINKFLLFLLLQIKVNVLDRNDSPPIFRDLPLTFTVTEDLGAGQAVATIRSTDPDTIGKLEYSLENGDDGKFMLEKDTGVLKLRDTLDRETKDTYKLVIRVTDGVQHTETTIKIQVCKVDSYVGAC